MTSMPCFSIGGDSHGPKRAGLRRLIGRGHQEHLQLLGPLLVLSGRGHPHRRHPGALLHLAEVSHGVSQSTFTSALQ